MAEFALVAPVLVLLIVGMLVFGRLFFYWIEANHVANETARWAVVDNNPYDQACELAVDKTDTPGCQTLQQHARSSATVEFKNKAKVCISFPGKDFSTVTVGDPVQVKVRVPVTFFGIFNLRLTLRGTSTMRMESVRNADPTEYLVDANAARGNIGDPC